MRFKLYVTTPDKTFDVIEYKSKKYLNIIFKHIINDLIDNVFTNKKPLLKPIEYYNKIDQKYNFYIDISEDLLYNDRAFVNGKFKHLGVLKNQLFLQIKYKLHYFIYQKPDFKAIEIFELLDDKIMEPIILSLLLRNFDKIYEEYIRLSNNKITETDIIAKSLESLYRLTSYLDTGVVTMQCGLLYRCIFNIDFDAAKKSIYLTGLNNANIPANIVFTHFDNDYVYYDNDNNASKWYTWSNDIHSNQSLNFINIILENIDINKIKNKSEEDPVISTKNGEVNIDDLYNKFISFISSFYFKGDVIYFNANQASKFIKLFRNLMTDDKLTYGKFLKQKESETYECDVLRKLIDFFVDLFPNRSIKTIKHFVREINDQRHNKNAVDTIFRIFSNNTLRTNIQYIVKNIEMNDYIYEKITERGEDIKSLVDSYIL